MDPHAVDALLADADGDEGTDGHRVPHGSTDDPWRLDFSANTNPVTPEGVGQVYQSALPAARTYPSDDYCSYRAEAADYVDCEAPQVIPTPGGLAAIRLAIATTVPAGASVLVPYPSFGEYAREIRLQGAEPVFVPHDELLDADPGGHAMAIVCNPNNPTGEAYAPTPLRAFAERCRDSGTVLLADEAFLGFTEDPSLAGRPEVIVARSLTKLFGLPGLRAGFAVATGHYRERMDAARLTWGLGGPAAAVGEHCMGCDEFVARTRDRVRDERARVRERLSARFDVFPSDAPFLLLDAGDETGADAAIDDAREADIAIRDARTFRGLDSHVRVAIRTESENDQLLAAFDV